MNIKSPKYNVIRTNTIILMINVKSKYIIASKRSHTHIFLYDAGEFRFVQLFHIRFFGWMTKRTYHETKWSNKNSPITWLIHPRRHIWHYPVGPNLLYSHLIYDRHYQYRNRYCNCVHCGVEHMFDSYHAIWFMAWRMTIHRIERYISIVWAFSTQFRK